MNTKVVEVHYFTKEKIGLILQLLLLIVLIIFGILYLLGKTEFIILESIIVLLLFIMAFNNKCTFKKKNMTILYLMIGIFMLISILLEVLL